MVLETHGLDNRLPVSRLSPAASPPATAGLPGVWRRPPERGGRGTRNSTPIVWKATDRERSGILPFRESMSHPDHGRWGHLKINENDLVEAIGSSFAEMQQYLDLKTGGIVIRQEDFRSEDVEDPSLPQWQREQLALNRMIDENPEGRFVEIEPVDPSEAYRWMREFVDTVEDATVREELARAIAGRKPFRSLKDALHNHLDERNRWFHFESSRRIECAREWLDSLEISYELVKANANDVGKP
jgi:hypothetical protein